MRKTFINQILPNIIFIVLIIVLIYLSNYLVSFSVVTLNIGFAAMLLFFMVTGNWIFISTAVILVTAYLLSIIFLNKSKNTIEKPYQKIVKGVIAGIIIGLIINANNMISLYINNLSVEYFLNFFVPFLCAVIAFFSLKEKCLKTFFLVFIFIIIGFILSFGIFNAFGTIDFLFNLKYHNLAGSSAGDGFLFIIILMESINSFISILVGSAAAFAKYIIKHHGLRLKEGAAWK